MSSISLNRPKNGDKIVKRFAGGRQSERPSLEEAHAKVFLELRHLCTHRRLLDPIGNLAACGHDPFASRDIIEQLQMMHVEHIDYLNIQSQFINYVNF